MWGAQRRQERQAADRENRARSEEEMEAMARDDELDALAAGDYEEAAFCDVRGHVHGQAAQAIRRGRR